VTGYSYSATPPGLSSIQDGQTITVDGDLMQTGSDALWLTFDSPTGGAGFVIVPESLSGPSLSICDASVTEGNSGTTNANFTVSLSAPSAQTITVDYSTSSFTASSSSDFAATSGTLTFNPYETNKSLNVLVNGDTVYELDENFFVNLGSATGASILDGVGQGTIVNDDSMPSIVIGDVTSVETNSGTTSFNFPVTLSHASQLPVTVNYATTAGTAESPSDYTAVSGTLTFAPGQTSMYISAIVNGDTDDEDFETFSMDLSSPVNATLSDGTGAGTIQNEDSSISIEDITTSESSIFGSTFEVVLSKPSALSVTVDFNTANGTALSGSDYTAISGTVTFDPGEVWKSVTVVMSDDNVYEGNEEFLVNLSNPANATISEDQAAGTIEDDESQPSITIEASPNSSVQEGNSGATIFSFLVTLSNASWQTVTIDYATANDSATAGSDYEAKSGTLTFDPLETSKTIEVTIYGDTTIEGYESFIMDLLNPVNASLMIASSIGSISDDDELPPW